MELTNSKPKRLISASVLERDHGLPKGTTYRLVKAGKIPYYNVGPKLTGIRFIAEEVLDALRGPYRIDDSGMSGEETEELKGATRVNGKSRIAKNIKENNSSRSVEHEHDIP